MDTGGRRQERSDVTASAVDNRLVGRVRLGLWIVLGVIPLFGLADLGVYPQRLLPLYFQKALHALCVILSIQALRRWPRHRLAVYLALLNVAVALGMTAAAGVAVHDDTTTALLAAVIATLSAAVMPWGLREHLAVIAIGLATTLANVLLVVGSLPVTYSYRGVAIVTIWVLSTVLARDLARQRGIATREERERRRAETELEKEAQVSAALARAGRALIGALHEEGVLDRLCEVTTDVLGCDFSQTWLWQETDDALAPVAAFGDSPDTWDAVRQLRVSRTDVAAAPLARNLRGGAVAQILADSSGALCGLPAGIDPGRYGATALLCAPLYRGRDFVGTQVAGYRGHKEAFTNEEVRIAAGVARLASLALENTRLLRRLREANQVKSQFVANMSHELRTPLNIILGYNDLMLTGAYGPLSAELTETVQRIRRSARNLSGLVNAMLDVGRVETGKLELEIQELSPAQILAELEEETREMRANSHLGFFWDAEADIAPVHSDGDRLKMVLQHLIGNAIKFTRAGCVKVSTAARENGVEFAVRDTGIGIPTELHQAIFEPFRQGDGSITRTYGGVGLGLYLSRRLLAVMDGCIKVESQTGRGSVFRVWIPHQIEPSESDAAHQTSS